MNAPACADVRENLSPYIEGDLPPGQAGEIRAHLERCANCRAELEFLHLTLGALHCLPEVPPPAGILAGVRARLRPEPWYRRLLDGRQWLVGVPVGAVATLLIVVGVSLFQARIPVSEKMGPPAVREAREASPAPAAAPPAPAPPAVTSAPAGAPAPVEPVAPPPMAGEVKRTAVERDRSLDRRDAPVPAGPREQEAPRPSPAADPPPAPGRDSRDARIEEGLPGPVAATKVAREAAETPPPAAVAQRPDLSEGARPQVRKEAEEAPLSRFVIPEPPAAPGGAAALEDSAGGRAGKPRFSSPGRSAAVGALEAEPTRVTSLRAAGNGASAPSASPAEKRPAPRAAASGASAPAAVRRAGGEFRMASAPPPAADRETSPGMVSLGRAEAEPPARPGAPPPQAEPMLEARRRPEPETSRRILLVLAKGLGINDLKRLLRREGAGVLESRVLEPRAVQEAFAPYRDRLALAAPPARGWSLRAEIPPRALPRLLDALAEHTGLALLEHPGPEAGAGRPAAPLKLHITVLR